MYVPQCVGNLGFVQLTCVVYVCFVRKGVQLQESERYVMRARGTTLTVRNIQQDDGGSYTCKASNKAGEVEHELFLKVFGENTFFIGLHNSSSTKYFHLSGLGSNSS